MIRTVVLFLCTHEYLMLFKSVFSLNKQIFQLFQFIRAILRLLTHVKSGMTLYIYYYGHDS